MDPSVGGVRRSPRREKDEYEIGTRWKRARNENRPARQCLTGRSRTFGKGRFGSAQRRQRHADAADVLEAGLALASRVLQTEGLAALDEVVANVAVVLRGGELRDVAVVDDGGPGVIHYALLLEDERSLTRTTIRGPPWLIQDDKSTSTRKVRASS